jgi:hypothetical protein
MVFFAIFWDERSYSNINEAVDNTDNIIKYQNEALKIKTPGAVICDIIKLTRKSLFLGLIVAIIISDSFIYFAEVKTKAFYSSWIISINASTAAALAVFVVYRHMQQRSHHPQDHHHSKSHVALAIGLSLWLCADIIWAIYEIVLEIVPPVPSAADFVWLSAYGFLAYYLYSTYIEFHKRFNFNTKILAASIIGCGIFLTYIITLTSSLSVFIFSKRHCYVCSHNRLPCYGCSFNGSRNSNFVKL